MQALNTFSDGERSGFSESLVKLRAYAAQAQQRWGVIRTALAGTDASARAEKLYGDALEGMQHAVALLERIAPGVAGGGVTQRELETVVAELSDERHFAMAGPVQCFHRDELAPLLQRASAAQLEKAGITYDVQHKYPHDLNCDVVDPATGAHENVIVMGDCGTSDPNYTSNPILFAAMGMTTLGFILSRKLEQSRRAAQAGADWAAQERDKGAAPPLP